MMAREEANGPSSVTDAMSGPQSLPVSQGDRLAMEFNDISLIGQGGCGMVFRARNRLDGVDYAVKVVEMPVKQDQRDRVMREVQALSRLQHPNVLRFHGAWMQKTPAAVLEVEVGQDDSFGELHGDSIYEEQSQVSDFGLGDESHEGFAQHCLVDSSAAKPELTSVWESPRDCDGLNTPSDTVGGDLVGMDTLISSTQSLTSEPLLPDPPLTEDLTLCIQTEFCAKTLAQIIDEEPVGDHERWKWLTQSLSALDYVHAHGLVHRDIKPSNLFLNADRILKVGDFGLVSQQLQPGKTSAGTSSLSMRLRRIPKSFSRGVGTAMYMSPEAYHGEYQGSTDVFGVGLCLLELSYKFNTRMEKVEALNAIRNHQQLPRGFDKAHPVMADIIKKMTAQQSKRPTCRQILDDMPGEIGLESKCAVMEGRLHKLERKLADAEAANEKARVELRSKDEAMAELTVSLKAAQKKCRMLEVQVARLETKLEDEIESHRTEST